MHMHTVKGNKRTQLRAHRRTKKKYFEILHVSSSFQNESISKTTIINIRLEATQRVVAAKLTRLTHKIAIIQLHLVAESCTICSTHSRQPVRKLLDTPSYTTV